MSVRNILDGTIPVGGSIGPGILDEVKTNSLTVDTSGMLCTGPLTCASTATVDKVNIITGITTPSLNIEGTKVVPASLTIGGNEVLKMIKSSGSRVIVGTLASSGNQMTFSATGSSRILDITSEMHAIDIIATMKECVTMKSLTFNTGLKLEGRHTKHTAQQYVR